MGALTAVGRQGLGTLRGIRASLPALPAFPRPAGGGGGVFAINFVRREILPLVLNRILAYAAVAYLGVQVLVMVTLVGSAFTAAVGRHQLQARFQGKVPTLAVARSIQREMKVLNDRAARSVSEINKVIALKKQQFPLGGKLAALTKTVPGGTWITDLSGDREKRTLTIHATHLVNQEGPSDDSTKQWIDALKADPAFRQELKRIHLTSASQEKRQGDAQVATFELVAEW